MIRTFDLVEVYGIQKTVQECIQKLEKFLAFLFKWVFLLLLHLFSYDFFQDFYYAEYITSLGAWFSFVRIELLPVAFGILALYLYINNNFSKIEKDL